MDRSIAGRAVAAMLVIVAAGACNSSSSAIPNDAGAEDVGSEPLGASCGGDDVPSGACAANAACSYSARCGPGVRMVCSTRWTCTCVEGQWACSIAPGSGFGCVPCPAYEDLDGGADATDADADATDADGP